MFKYIAKQLVAFPILLVAALAFASPALAQTTETSNSAEQINAANQLLRDGEIDQAIEGYRDIVANDSNRDQLNYNLAVAQYRKSDINSAASLFTETAGSTDLSIAARSQFNLGNCVYATALQTAEKDKPSAIQQLRQAISHYRGSLRSLPENNDARANIELAAELIRKLEEEQKQEDQQDQKNQDQKNQDQKNQDQKNQDQKNQDQKNQDQKNQDQQNQDQQNQSNQDDQQQSQDQQDSESQESKPQDSKSDSSNAENQEPSSDDPKDNDQQEQPSDSSSSDEPQDKSQDSAQPKSDGQQPKNQNQPKNDPSKTGDSESPDDSEPEEQSGEKQPTPTGELTAADKQDNKDPKGSVAMADPNVKDGAMTKEEALKMLQAVRDRDMLRRLKKQQRERSRRVPVDRDW